MTDAPTTPEKRKRGRKPGAGKVPGSGRRKGTPNKTTQQIRDFIAKHADPFPLLARVIKGQKIKVADPEDPTKQLRRIPTMDERIAAARVVAPKIAPDMRETALTGAGGGVLAVNINLGPKPA